MTAIPRPWELRADARAQFDMLLYFKVACGVPVTADVWRDAFGQAVDWQTVVDARRELAGVRPVAVGA